MCGHRLAINGIYSPTSIHGDSAPKVCRKWLGLIDARALPVVSCVDPGCVALVGVPTSRFRFDLRSDRQHAEWLPLASVPVAPIARFDMRLMKSVTVHERYKAVFRFDAFNVFNHTNFTSVNTRAYTYSQVSGVPMLTYQLALRFIW